MATQDSSGGVNWGNVALSALGGAAAGYSADNAGQGFLQGLSFQQQQQDRKRQIAMQEKQMQQRDRLNNARIRNAELTAQERDLLGFNQEMSMYSKLAEQDVLGFQKNYSSRATAPRPNDNKYIYPISEDQAVEIDSHTRASKSIANTRMYIASLERSLNPRNKAEGESASRMQAILGQQLGYQFIPENGDIPAQVRTPWGAFPATMESAPKIMERAREDAFAARKQYETSRRLKSQAESGLLRAGYKSIEGFGNLGPKQATAFANGYSNQIKSDDFLFRNHSVAHGMDFILNDKGRDMTEGEAVLMSNLMDKHNIRYDANQQGEFKIHAGDFNKYVNKFLPEDQRKQVLDSNDWVEVDNDLVQKIYNRSGISTIKDRWQEEAARVDANNKETAFKSYQSSLARKQQEAIVEADTKDTIERTMTSRRANRLDPKLSIEETINNFEIPMLSTGEGGLLRDNPDLIDGVRFEANEMAQREALRSVEARPLAREYSIMFPGQKLEEDLKNKTNDDVKEAAQKFVSQRSNIKVEKDRVDFFMREGLKKLRSRNGVKRMLRTMYMRGKKASAEQEGPKKVDAISNKLLGN
jgi:hypothetical protein